MHRFVLFILIEAYLKAWGPVPSKDAWYQGNAVHRICLYPPYSQVFYSSGLSFAHECWLFHIHLLGSVILCWDDPIFDPNSAPTSLWLKGQIVIPCPCPPGKETPSYPWFCFWKSVLALTFHNDPALLYLAKLRQAWPEKWLRKK